MSRPRASLGILPDDLYIEPEPWPRIGRPLEHDLETWKVADDRPNEPPRFFNQVLEAFVACHQAGKRRIASRE